MDYLQYGSSDDDGDTPSSSPPTSTKTLVTATATATANETLNNDNNNSSHKTNVIPKIKRVLTHPAPHPSTLATLQLSTISSASTAQNLFNTNSNTTNSSNSNQQQLIMTNPRKSQLMQPIQGPQLFHDNNNPNAIHTNNKSLSKGQISLAIQHNVAFDSTMFDTQRNSFQRHGVAFGPNDDANGGVSMGMGTTDGVVQRTTYGHERKRFNKETNRLETVKVVDDRFQKEGHKDDGDNDSDNNGDEMNNNTTTTNTNSTNPPPTKKRCRGKTKNKKINDVELVQDSDDEINYGIWGPPTQETIQLQNDTLSTLEKMGGVISSLPIEMQTEREYLKERNRQRSILNGTATNDGDDEDGVIASRENQNFDKLVERKMAHLLPPRIIGEEAKPTIEATTKFHLSPQEEFNYKNESWITPPTELKHGVEFGDVDHHTCFVPKKCVARFLGHNKGVHRIRLSPNTGHLLLSGGLDGKCKVWNVITKKVCRTYIGHSAAVRDVQFNHDGTRFISCSFDRFIRLWDTESGKVLNTFTNRRVPYVLKFYPLDDNIFVVGCSDNKIVAYDCTSGEITQEYNHHLAPVNTITFVEDHGMKMITTSDDKKILIWEWDIGVPIKYISDPMMHSIPVVTLHPSLGYFVGQSLDNQIVVYQAKDRFATQKKKKFSGHLVSGYACDIAISPDGQFVCSGDGNGKLFFWDWRRSRILQKYHAHDKGPAIGCVWHPVLPNTVFTCGWDGVIKMWE
jgi:pre-mRNA-processing factor 17